MTNRRPSPPVSRLDSHLGFRLRQVSNHVSQAFAAKLAGRGVTVAEWAVMRTLYDAPPSPPSRIADKMGMTRGAITKLADRLIAKVLVAREADPDDGRAQILALTPAGIALVPQLAALADVNDAQFFDHLTPPERELLDRLLKQIVDRSRIAAIPID